VTIVTCKKKQKKTRKTLEQKDTHTMQGGSNLGMPRPQKVKIEREKTKENKTPHNVELELAHFAGTRS
jgi:hypothetical protein